MKKCPKCHAEIEENARFCLYCMTSFEEKETIKFKEENKRWMVVAVSAFLVIALVVGSFFVFTKKDASNNYSKDSSTETSINSNTYSNSSTDSNTVNASQDGNSSVSGQPSTTDNDKNNITTQNGSSKGSNNSFSVHSPNAQSSTANNSASKNVTSNEKTPSKKEDGSSNQNSTQNNTDSSNNTGTPTETNTPKYEYITATIENTYPTGYSTIHPPENAIVITKVTGNATNGNYVISDTIDGKKVAAIMPSAFSEVSASVKSVTLPSTVRTIWNNAFKNCYGLTDIYIKSAVIGIYTDAFPEVSKRNGTLTIHCSRECMDFDYYYYRNISDKYDAVYKEWNG